MNGYPIHDECGGLLMMPYEAGMPVPKGVDGVAFCTTCSPKRGLVAPKLSAFVKAREASRAAGAVEHVGELRASYVGTGPRVALARALSGDTKGAKRKRNGFALCRSFLLVNEDGTATEAGRDFARRIGLVDSALPLVESEATPEIVSPILAESAPVAPSAETGDAPAAARTSPLLKWAGGKGRLLKSILPILPPTFGRYLEPFAGGLALFFRLQPRGAYLSDANQHLVRIYRAVRNHADDVIAALQEHKNDRAYYDRVRDDFNDGYGDDIWRAAALMYMNRAGFNGVCRFNGDGKYNVPFGDGNPKTLCDVENIRACSALLQESTVEWADFRKVEAVAQAGDFCYLDSPYLPENAASFVKYTKDGFTAQDHEDVAALFRRLTARGVHVLASNSDTPKARELYAGFEMRELTRSNSVNSKVSARGGKRELLILGGTWTPRGAT